MIAAAMRHADRKSYWLTNQKIVLGCISPAAKLNLGNVLAFLDQLCHPIQGPEHERTALYWATVGKHEKAAEELFLQGANILFTGEREKTLLH